MSEKWKALFLDLDNCLIDRDSAFRAMMNDNFDVFSDKEWERITRADNHAYTKRRAFSNWFVQHFPNARIKTSKDQDLTADDFYQFQLEKISGYIAPASEQTINLLTALSNRFQLFLLTNGGAENQRKKLKKANLVQFFTNNYLFVSGYRNDCKPDQSFYQAALDSLSCDNSEVLMIGDDPINDMEGARNLGISTCWISMGREFPIDLEPPEYSFEKFEDFNL